MLADAVRSLSDEELLLARLLAWEEVKDAQGTAAEDLWAGILATLVLETARRGGAPVDEVAAAVEGVLRADVAAADELTWRQAHEALRAYSSGRAGHVLAQGPAGEAILRFPRLERFWREVQRFVEAGGTA